MASTESHRPRRSAFSGLSWPLQGGCHDHQLPDPDGYAITAIPEGEPRCIQYDHHLFLTVEEAAKEAAIYTVESEAEVVALFAEDKVLAAYEAGRASMFQEIEDQKMKVAGIP